MTAVIRQMTDAETCQSRTRRPVYHRPMEHPRTEMARRGRSLETFDWSVLGGIGDAGATGDAERVRELIGLGFQRINLTLPPDSPDQQWLQLEELATLVQSFQ